MPLERRRELLVHRCFVSYDHPEALEDVGGNWSFYDKDSLAVRRSDVLWPLSESLLLRRSEVKPPVP